MNSASSHRRSTSGDDQAATGGMPLVLGPVRTDTARPLDPLAVHAALHTGGRTHHWDIGRPDTAADPGFLGRAFRHLDDRTL